MAKDSSNKTSSPKRRFFTPERRLRFLEELKERRCVTHAARAVGFSTHCAYEWRNKDDEFRTGWESATKCKIVHEPREINPGGYGPRTAMVARRHDSPTDAQLAEFLIHLAMTSNVSESAREAGIVKQTAYRRYNRDKGFARRWAEALSEGYEHLEMEMLARARFGTQMPKFHGKDTIGSITRYTDATALKLLTVHKEAVAHQRAFEQGIDEDEVLNRIDAKLAQMKDRAETGDTNDDAHGVESHGED